MKVLIVGANSNYAIERFFLKYLNEVPDITAELFVAQNLFLDWYQKNPVNKILFRLGYKRIYMVINKALKERINESNPDVLFVFKGMEIFPETLTWAKKHGVKLVNYNPDNPFIFSGKGSGNSNITRSISIFHLHLTYNKEVKLQMEREYNIPTVILPFGFDIDESTYEICCKEREIKKLCFVGNPDKYRSAFIAKLAGEGIHVDVYGNNWQRYISHPNVTVHKMVAGDELWKTLYRYRVQLNLMRPHNLTTHNMRSIEIAGIGGIQLAPDTEDHRKYFIPGKEIFLFKNVEDCKRQISRLMAMIEKESGQIRLNARKRAVESGYSYKNRTLQALDTISALTIN